MDERTQGMAPRAGPLVTGLALVVSGLGALLIDADVVAAEPMAVVAAALLVAGTAALVVLVAASLRRPRP